MYFIFGRRKAGEDAAHLLPTNNIKMCLTLNGVFILNTSERAKKVALVLGPLLST